MIRIGALSGLVFLSLSASSVGGELEIGLYGGMNESAQSYGELSNGVDVQGGTLQWKGLSFQPPIYYGARATYWFDSMPNFGIGLDYTHAKIYADLGQLGAGDSYSWLEFTDGLNLVTANAFYKLDWDNGLRAYGGLGAGLSIPRVEVITKPSTVVGATETFEYQITGPAFQGIVGASYQLFDNVRVFGEYKLSYSINEARLQGGGTFSTNVASHHVLAGISYSFDAGGL